MDNSLPPDLAATLRAALPPAYQTLAEPLARALEALANPTTNAVIAKALAELDGRAISLSTTGAINLAGAQTGDLTVRDVVGGNSLHLTLNLAGSLPPEIHVSDDQLRILQFVARHPDAISGGVSAVDVAAAVRLPLNEVELEFEDLGEKRFLELMPRVSGAYASPLLACRKLLRRKRQELLEHHGLEREHGAILVALLEFGMHTTHEKLQQRVQLQEEVLQRKLRVLYARRLIHAQTGDDKIFVSTLAPEGLNLAEQIQRFPV